MLLKKQTVWLLTMLSLIIVLSVYYITAPSQSPSELAYQDDENQEIAADQEEGDATALEEENEPTVADTNGSTISSISDDEMFTTLRMQIQEKRDKMGEDYTDVIASANVAPEVQAQAMTKLEELNELAMREATLETLIASMGFEDVLVNTMDDEVQVIIKTENEITKEEANNIMVTTRDELGTSKTVSVKTYTTKNEG